MFDKKNRIAGLNYFPSPNFKHTDFAEECCGLCSYISWFFFFLPIIGVMTGFLRTFAFGFGFMPSPRHFGKHKALTIISRSKRKSLRN